MVFGLSMNDSNTGGVGTAPLPPGQSQDGPTGLTGPERLKAKHEEIKRRGTPPGAKRGPYKKGGAASGGDFSGPAPAPVLPAWNYDSVKSVMETPFELMAAWRDKIGWRLDEREAKAGVPLAVPVFNQFVPLEGKWTALSICALVWLKIAGAKVLQDVAHEKALRLDREQKAKSTNSPSQENPTPTASATGGVGPLSPTKAAVIQ